MTDADDVIQRIEELPDGQCITLAGEVDLSRSPGLRIRLLQLVARGLDRLVVDLTNVPYMDSSGVATLVEALQHQRRHGAKMVLFGLQPKVRSIFEIARLDTVFTIVDDVEQARTA